MTQPTAGKMPQELSVMKEEFTMSNKIRLLCIAFLIFALAIPASSTLPPTLASSPLGSPASPSVVTRTLYLDADTYSLRSESSVNFGEDPFLEITNEPSLDPQNVGSTYLHFDLSSIPAGVTIESASILFHLPSGGYGSDCLVELRPIADPWEEMTLNYENAPALEATPSLQRHLPTGVEFVAWDVTEIVASWVATGGMPSVESNGLAISPISSGLDYVHFFSSRESQDPPELTINYSTGEHWYSYLGRVATYTENPGEQRPLADTIVALYEAYPWDPGLGYPLGHLEMTAQTDQNGDYSLNYYLPSDTPAITYTLVVSTTQVHVIDTIVPLPGYGTSEGYIRYNPDTLPGVYPENKFIVAPNEVPNWQHWTFSGQVFSSSPAEPVSGVSVVLYGTHNINESENILAGAATDELGRFNLLASRKDGESYPYFILKVEDYNFVAREAAPGPGGYATEDHRLVFTSPSPDDYPDNSFTVSGTPADSQQLLAPASGFKNQPLVAMILNYNCTCGTASDCQHITNTKVLSTFGETLFSSTQDSLNNYFIENSQYHLGLKQAGLYIITPTDDTNTTLDESSNCSSGNSIEQDRAHFVRDLLGTQLGFNFASYDKNSDGVVDNSELIVLVAFATPNHWISKVSSTDPAQIQIGSVKVKMDVISTSVAQDFYTLAHEIAHALPWTRRSGSPGDNYGGQGNPGAYGLMDNHCSGPSTVPGSLMPNTPVTGTLRMYGRLPHLDPWNKIQLGWIISDTYSSPTWVTFDPVETDGDVYRVGTSGGTGEYFLVENRAPSASEFDSDLLDSGLAIWHINENYMPDERRVIALERAGGGTNSGQATDNCNDDTDSTALWDGTEDFWNGSSPSSKWYNGSNSQVTVACISPPSDQINAYLSSSWSQTILAHDSSEPNDTYQLAKPVLAGSYDRNLHASCDTDLFTIGHWTNATIGVTVSAFQDAAHTIPASAPTVLLEQDDFFTSTSYQGVGSASGIFSNYGITSIKIYNSSQPIYYRMVVSNSQATVPPDRFDDETPAGEQPNDSFSASAVITDAINENTNWFPGLEVDTLNFHASSDIDYFTFQLPSLTNTSGYSECLSLSDPRYGPEVITGSLTVKVVPTFKRAFSITALDSSGNVVNQYDSLGPWEMLFYCPHDHFNDGKITLAFEDSANAINFYEINLTYHRWQIRYDFPGWLLYTDPPLYPPIPEMFDPRLKFIYPITRVIQWALLEGTALLPLPTEYLPIHHDFGGSFHLELITQAGKGLNVRLYDSNQNLVGSGVPSAGLRAMIANPFLPDLPAQSSTQILDVPFLPAGWYAIALDGASSFTEFWLKFDKNWLYLPVVNK
jgi:M6 family metalloprotease-like protein